MSKKNESKPAKAGKNDSKTENAKDVGTLKNIGKTIVNFVESFDKKKEPKTEEPKVQEPVTPAPQTPKQPEGILPVGEEIPKVEGIAPVAEPAKPSKKYFSDKIYEIKSDIALFIGGVITAQRGLKIHRIEEKRFLLSGVDDTQKPFEEMFPDFLGDEISLLPENWITVFQKELDEYEIRLKEDEKADRLKPKPKAGVDAPPPLYKEPTPIVYATSGVADMEAYGELIYKNMMKSPIITHRNDKFTAIEVEKNLKSESTLYGFALKFDQKQKGWYIDIIQGRNAVRVPKDPALFLPIK